MMLLQKSLMTLSALLLATSCSKPEVQAAPIVTEVVQTTIPTKPRPRPVDLLPVNFRVVTNDNIDAYISSISSNGEFVFVAMTVKGYENLSMNVDELRRYIEQQNAVIIYYEGYAVD